MWMSMWEDQRLRMKEMEKWGRESMVEIRTRLLSSVVCTSYNIEFLALF